MVIAKAPSDQAYGNMIFAQSPSRYVLTTLALNASAMNTASTSPET
jgi:hypothetical protein